MRIKWIDKIENIIYRDFFYISLWIIIKLYLILGILFYPIGCMFVNRDKIIEELRIAYHIDTELNYLLEEKHE